MKVSDWEFSACTDISHHVSVYESVRFQHVHECIGCGVCAQKSPGEISAAHGKPYCLLILSKLKCASLYSLGCALLCKTDSEGGSERKSKEGREDEIFFHEWLLH